MVWPSARLLVSVPEIPLLRRLDDSAKEFVTHQLGLQTPTPASAANDTRQNKRRSQSPPIPMFGPGVLPHIRTGPNCWQRRPQSLVGRTRAHNSRSSGGRSRASPLAEMSSTHPSCSHCTGPGFRELRRTTSSSAYRASTRGIGQDFLGRVVFSGDTEEREEFTAGSCGPAGLKNLVQTFYAWGCPVAYAAPVEPEHSAH